MQMKLKMTQWMKITLMHDQKNEHMVTYNDKLNHNETSLFENCIAMPNIMYEITMNSTCCLYNTKL